MAPTAIELAASLLFALALAHTFAAHALTRLGHRYPAHEGLFHLLGEVEVVFGLWAFVLLAVHSLLVDWPQALAYVEGRNFTEPLFVFVIMVIAASRPVLFAAEWLVRHTAHRLPVPTVIAEYFLSLALVPLLGSLITEPAAMTVAALLLHQRLLSQPVARTLPQGFLYFTLGVLFVNISIGGTLTHFAAPPVLMVASVWQWNTPFMFATFGIKALLAVLVNALLATLWLAHLLRHTHADVTMPHPTHTPVERRIPAGFVILHLLLLAAVVLTSHHPVVFVGIFLFFLGMAHAYPHWHKRLMLREGLLVAFFLAGLVVLGGLQRWWLQPALTGLSPAAVFAVATSLTAITDNAAITYLGAQLDGLSDSFKYALVAGAVAGGGLTIIANAPNPAGVALLRGHFPDQSVNALLLLRGAAVPTLVAVLCLGVGM